MMLLRAGIGAIHVFDHESNRSLAGELSDLVAKGAVTVERFEGNHKKFEKGFSSHLDRFRKTAQVRRIVHACVRVCVCVCVHVAT